jgi:hypothetical protein
MTKAVAAVAEGSAANVMTRYLIPIAIGAVLGSAMGYFGQCSYGTCPLTSTWWRGAIYGGVMGLLFAFSSHR